MYEWKKYCKRTYYTNAKRTKMYTAYSSPTSTITTWYEYDAEEEAFVNIGGAPTNHHSLVLVPKTDLQAVFDQVEAAQKKQRKVLEGYTIMLWLPKRELRVIQMKAAVEGWESPCGRSQEFRFLDEHKDNPPHFSTVEEAWDYIKGNYPELHP